MSVPAGRFEKCDGCSGEGKLHVRVPCPDCEGAAGFWVYQSQDEMRFGPRVYTAAQAEEIADAAANRRPLNTPPIPLEGPR